MDTVTGSVERVSFYNPENGYTVLRLRPERRRAAFPAYGVDREGLVTVVGNLPELTPGEYLRLQGQFINHPKFGIQFQVEVCEQAYPATLAGIEKYLGSGLIKGIGTRLAAQIVRHFGQETLDVIDHAPERLAEVPDIGPKRTALIASAWQEQRQVKEIMLYLHAHGVSTNLAVKIYKTYQEKALEVVKTNPYQLARDIYGIGFKTADKIAQALGLAAEHPSRIEAGLVYVLNEMTNDGHVYLPEKELIQRAVDLLDVPAEMVPGAVERLAADGLVQPDILPVESGAGPSSQVADQTGTPVVYSAPMYYGEIGVARRLKMLANTLPSALADIPPMFIHLDSTLSPEQQQAIRTALTHPVSVLTGGPGTGKTTAIKELIGIAQGARKRFALCSPTGRAAKRLSEATGQPASTIHRLLDYSPTRGFVQNEDNPLPVDLLVVDEASMLDLPLANSLLKAIPPGAHLLLVGDVDQLPSVGAGDVLRDLIHSGVAPVTRLSVIFRQAAGSHIITNAHRINQGLPPEFPRDSQDFFLFPASEPEQAADWVVQVMTERIPQRFQLNPLEDIQVLSPMYRGPAGVTALNARLQKVLNPPRPGKPEKTLYGTTYRPGDKVMQTQNDYDKEVFNGDIGFISFLDMENHSLGVIFDGRTVVYDWMETDQLTLAYAISVHKSQGAEFPAVILPMVTQHYMMLQRNLLYTAVTRAKKLCVLVGTQKAIQMAVRNNKVSQRYTALDWRLSREK